MKSTSMLVEMNEFVSAIQLNLKPADPESMHIFAT